MNATSVTLSKSGFSPGNRAFAIVMGLLLLGTALLKVDALSVAPAARDPLFASPRLLVAVIEIEVVLGLWLVSAYARLGAWATGLLFFCSLSALVA